MRIRGEERQSQQPRERGAEIVISESCLLIKCNNISNANYNITMYINKNIFFIIISRLLAQLYCDTRKYVSHPWRPPQHEHQRLPIISTLVSVLLKRPLGEGVGGGGILGGTVM